MLTQSTIFEGLKKLISKKNIISISGASGLGKTTLAQYLIGKLLINFRTQDYCSIWIQASEAFSSKRLSKIFEKNPIELEYIKNNVYIIPSKKPCVSYLEQNSVLKSIWSKDSIFSPDLKFIVIDNISHHLRYELSNSHDIESTVSIINSFFDQQLHPLIMFCEREDITLFLIHEVTYDPIHDRIAPFCYKLYDRINSLDLILKKKDITQEKIMEINYDNLNWAFNYLLVDQGLKFKF